MKFISDTYLKWYGYTIKPGEPIDIKEKPLIDKARKMKCMREVRKVKDDDESGSL